MIDRKKLVVESHILSEIGDAMTDSETEAYFDLVKKEVVRVFREGDMGKEHEDLLDQIDANEGSRYLAIPNHEHWLGYEDMVAFIESLEDVTLKGQLAASIQGKGAFGRFDDILTRKEPFRKQWHIFRAARQEVRAREWLKGERFDVSAMTSDQK